MVPGLILAAIAGLVAIVIWQRYRRLARERFIRSYPLPRGLYDKLRKRRPELEAKLGIAGGFVYSPDCKALRGDDGGGTVHCGAEFADSSVDGGTDGFGDSGSGGGDGGDGGGGCGGGGD
jgi:hypothetical protein